MVSIGTTKADMQCNGSKGFILQQRYQQVMFCRSNAWLFVSVSLAMLLSLPDRGPPGVQSRRPDHHFKGHFHSQCGVMMSLFDLLSCGCLKWYVMYDATKPCYVKLCESHVQDPIKVCRSLFRQLSGRDHRSYAAEETQLSGLGVSMMQRLQI